MARRLRWDMTEPQRRLWYVLRHDFSRKFRRQEPIGPYVCDFVCYAKRLVVEVDGIQHADSEHDRRRDRFLRRIGFEVHRVWNDDVMTRLDEVVEGIDAVLASRTDRHRNRRPRRGR